MSRHIYRKRQHTRSISLGTAEAFQSTFLENEQRRHGFEDGIQGNRFPALPQSPTDSVFSNRWNNPASPRINLEGSWLDLESEDEDDSEHINNTMTIRRRRKRSASPTRDALSSLKDKLLSRRSSVHFRKLAAPAF